MMVQYQPVDRTLAALADPTRRAVFERLGSRSATITELADPFGMSLTGMKKHVRQLEEAGLDQIAARAGTLLKAVPAILLEERFRAHPGKTRQTPAHRAQTVTGIRVKLRDLMQADAVTGHWLKTLPAGIEVVPWTRMNASFFKAVQMEKRVMFIILTLIVAVAAFNIVSAQVMLVTDKQADIAILRTLGATPASILVIFVIQGALIGSPRMSTPSCSGP